MGSVLVKTGAKETVAVGPIVNSAGVVLTGLTDIKAAVLRASDKRWLDWSTLAFAATPVTEYMALAELDATRAPGIYYIDVDTSTFVGVVAQDRYFVYVSQQGGTNAANASSLSEFRMGTVVDAVEATLDAAVSSRLASSGYAAPLDAPGTAAAVWDALTSAHTTNNSLGLLLGTYTSPPAAFDVAVAVWHTVLFGSYASNEAGYIVGTNLDAAVSSRVATSGYATSVANAVWQTTVPGSFSPGSAGFVLGNAPSAAGIASAVWATSEAGTPGTFGYGLWALRMGMTNKMGVTAPGTMVVYADNSATPFLTWTGVRDSTGQAISLPAGEPAQRLKAT